MSDPDERTVARNNPKIFLKTHPWPLVIDEVQYAPGLLEIIESEVDREKAENGSNNGMYVLIGSQAYRLMEGVTDSLAGRISILQMSPLSLSEALGREETLFSADLEHDIERSSERTVGPDELFERILHGMYPEPEVNQHLGPHEFYMDYVTSYIERDVSEIVNIRDKDRFRSFMQLMGSLTGQELNYKRIASLVGIDSKTVRSWTSVLIAGDIVHLLQPYSDRSTAKRIVKRPKMYFWDTGLACYLAKVLDTESLRAGYLRGPMVETFIVNEMLKPYRNAKREPPFRYYRDSNGNEIDLVMTASGKISYIECKTGTEPGWNDVKTMVRGIPSQYPAGLKCIICPVEKAYPLKDDVWVFPISVL